MNRALRARLMLLAVFVMVSSWTDLVTAATAVVSASKDNTLYEEIDGALSNGSGQFIFSGNTATGPRIRRALLAFDLSAIPPGSSVTSATLGLTLSMSISGERPVSIHRVNASWGESLSDAFGQEGGGTASALGDATWIHRFNDTTFWATPGGDFEPTPSATIIVDDSFIQWTWSSTETAADVQAWLDVPSTNYGWIVVGNEEDVATAKRFGSRENPIASERPVLRVEFTPPPGEGAGALAQSGLTALRVARASGQDLTLSWSASSCTEDSDFELYEGELRTPASHAPFLCSTLGLTSVTITPSAGDHYYLAVPRRGLLEGSYGTTTGAIERPPSAAACRPQSLLACP